MPGSQLKRLKASLRDQGIVGPQQSKKQKRKNAQDERARNEKRLQRGVVLEGIREQFNPFDLKHAARGPKFQVTSNRPATSSIKGRPGAAKAASEERRRQTLLVDMQRRNKVGGILDRRFGESDPTMTAEDKALERFAHEKQRSHKKVSMFDLEDDDGPIESLTHGGKALEFDDDEEMRDDFEEDDLANDSDESERGQQRLKRLRAMEAGGDEDPDQPERKKTKKEVMEEVIAKSKLYKMERQQAKEEDDDLREELDNELANIRQMLVMGRGKKNGDETGPASTIAGLDKSQFDRDFDVQIKKLAQDRRAQPSERTKTEEEKAEEESKRLKELEDRRQRRMRGEEVTDSEQSSDSGDDGRGDKHDSESDQQGDDDFGLGSGIRATKPKPTATELGFDDEDDFLIDDDLVASGSDVESIGSDEMSEVESTYGDGQADDGDEEDDFTKGLLNEEEERNPLFEKGTLVPPTGNMGGDEQGLPFTFPCPQSPEEFRSTIRPYSKTTIPTIVQRIRALYHPKLDAKNKERLVNFSIALVDFVVGPWKRETSPPFAILESLIRHIHSLAKSYPSEIGRQFRAHLESISGTRPLALQPEDLILLTAAGSVFPTSDHFHQVITPAMLTITRYLGQKVPQDLASFSTGTYLMLLALHYQQLSKRYVPELVNFGLNTLSALAPVAPPQRLGNFPVHESSAVDRISSNSKDVEIKRLCFDDCIAQDLDKASRNTTQVAVVATTLQTFDAAADLWTGKAGFIETFRQVVDMLKHFSSDACKKQLPASLFERSAKLHSKLERMIRLSQLERRPLELHHHRPLAIKTYIPKFEETFDPSKHYDPDRDRAELAKLKAEHKRERKGALRELRKDANFMAREKLKAKKAKDEAYEKKYKRLVAEIQSEEGKEFNAYEREKSARKRARNR